MNPLILMDFDVNRLKASTTGQGDFWLNLVKNAITPCPVINPGKCAQYGCCVRVCPAAPKAVEFNEGRSNVPGYTYRHCIRCYCCQEMCPEEAISIKRPALGGLLDRSGAESGWDWFSYLVLL